MPCIIKVRILGARRLENNAHSACATLRFGPFPVHHTPSYTIVQDDSFLWNEDYRYEVSDDSLIQDHPLQLYLYAANNTATQRPVRTADKKYRLHGRVLIDLNPLLAIDSPHSISGWLPLAGGLAGELGVQVRLLFFGDSNPFKDSSAGVQFFGNPGLPRKRAALMGLVDMELTLASEDNTEHESAEVCYEDVAKHCTKCTLVDRLYGMSGQLRRLLGKKVLEMGGNAVLAYVQSFDFDHWSKTITARGLGTAAKLFPDESSTDTAPDHLQHHHHSHHHSLDGGNLVEIQSPTGIIDILTISSLPARYCLSIGGIVSAKSVKLISEWSGEIADLDDDDGGNNNSSSSKIRDKWLNQLREEIRGHCRTLNCTTVLGYREAISCSGELYLLSAIGTAARIDPSAVLPESVSLISGEYSNSIGHVDDYDYDDAMFSDNDIVNGNSRRNAKAKKKRYRDCLPCHIPYKRHQTPFETEFVLCRLCGRRYVPQIIMSTVGPPLGIEMLKDGDDGLDGACGLVEAFVCKTLNWDRPKVKKLANAVSYALPFVEYDIHRQLVYKLRILGCNALFGLRLEIAVKSDCLVAIAQGTACFLAALPQPPILKINRSIVMMQPENDDIIDDSNHLVKRSSIAHETFERLIREHPRLGPGAISSSSSNDEGSESLMSSSSSSSSYGSSSSSSSSEDEIGDAMALIQIDDEADEDVMAVLKDIIDPSDALVQTLECPAVVNDKSFTIKALFSHLNIDTRSHFPNQQLSKSVHNILGYCHDELDSCCVYKLSIQLQVFSNHLMIASLATVLMEREGGRVDDRIMVCTTAAIPGHRITSNYGQLSFHLVQHCNDQTDHTAALKSLFERDLMDNVVAHAKALGGNAVTSLQIIYANYTDERVGLTVAGDVVEATALVQEEYSARAGSFSSSTRTLMIGQTIL